MNVANDSQDCGVPIILVVEDSVRFFSSFLPTIYLEVFRHTQSLLSAELNPSQRMMRMRARPKVLLCETFEQAWSCFERYREQVLGIISDIEFPRGGERSPSIIGTDLTIIGNLVSKGEVQIEGEVQGDLHGTQIVVGERAKITGGIVAEEVVVRGHVRGSIRVRRVMLQASSHVEGDVHHTTLAIEQGAFFEGKSRRSDDPIAGVTLPGGADGLPVPRVG